MCGLKIFFAPVGCPKANVDLERLAEVLKDAGWDICSDPREATVGIVFGCGFIDDAKRETIDTVLELAELKTHSGLSHLLMVGCLPQKYGEDLARVMREVDAFVGNSCLGLVPTVLGRLAAGRLDRRLWVEDSYGTWPVRCRRHALAPSPWTRTVMICDGCDNACTYCTIPHMRGPLRSRPADDIHEEISHLVDEGAREIILAGQDTASYGRDGGGASLQDLLAAVARRNPDQWIRLSYVNPDNLDAGVADVLREHCNICKYIDMPIQHASPGLLAMMGRKADPDILRARIEELRCAMPDIALRTSVIVGFPGEDETDFDMLTGFLREVRFDLVGVFGFSPQPGTPAAGLDGRIAADVTEARLLEVVSLQEEISKGKMSDLVGSTLQILIEGIDDCGDAVGRSEYDMPEIDRVVRLHSCRTEPGEFTYVRLEGLGDPYEWIGSESDLNQTEL